VALEMLAEVAAASKPGSALSAIRNLRNLHGVTYPNGAPRELHVEGLTPASTPGAPAALDVSMKAANSGQTHYRARVEFGGVLPALPPRLTLVNPRAFPLSIAEAYERWLFHGPLFAGITEILAMGDNGIIGRIKTIDIEKLIRPSSPGSWLVDPVVTDSSLQMGLLWTRAVYDQTALPSLMEAYYNIHPLQSASEILCEVEIRHKPGSPTLRCRHVFYDQDDRVLGWMEGMESTMSKALNRISQKTAEATGQ